MSHQKKQTQQTIQYFWKYIKKYPISFIFIMLGISIGVIFDSILAPVYFSKIIDLISTFDGSNKELILPEFIRLLKFLCASYLIGIVGWRTGAFLNCHFQPSCMRDIANDCFAKLHNHSLSFFSNNFIVSNISHYFIPCIQSAYY